GSAPVRARSSPFRPRRCVVGHRVLLWSIPHALSTSTDPLVHGSPVNASLTLDEMAVDRPRRRLFPEETTRPKPSATSGAGTAPPRPGRRDCATEETLHVSTSVG